MTTLDELIGYAKSNSESAALKDDRMTWAAHHRNCLKVKEERESDAKVIAALREALEAATCKLQQYRVRSSGEYVGGMEYSALMKMIAAAIKGNEQTVGESK